MAELRWILLVAGLALIAGLYAWGVRARKRSAAPEPGRVTRVEPLRAPSAATVTPSAARVEPSVWDEVEAVDEVDELPTLEIEAVEPAARHDAPPARREPRFEAAAEVAAPEPPRPAAPPVEERKPAPAQKIVAIRVAAPPPSMFAGSQLREAIVAEGFEFGRYDIFHRFDASGRPLCSLASLREPGTFDPDAMGGVDYRGVAMFTVLPGPLPSQHALDELIGAARLLAERLGGVLQDDRGAQLSLQRIGQLREEVAEFERSRAAHPPGR
jgi:cell division protein ZipA